MTSNNEDIKDLKSDLTETIKESFTQFSSSFQDQINAKHQIYNLSFKNIENEINLQKAKLVFIDIDKMRLLNSAYSDDQMKNFIVFIITMELNLI